jgi:hypothetical protein
MALYVLTAVATRPRRELSKRKNRGEKSIFDRLQHRMGLFRLIPKANSAEFLEPGYQSIER